MRGTPRDESFCLHAVVSRAALVVQDTFRNPLFRHNPLVRRRSLRFYAGVPLFARMGHAVGTLCLLDFKPRTFSHFDLELLSVMSRRVLADLDRREHRSHPHEPLSCFPHLGDVDEQLGILGRALFIHVMSVESSRCVEQHKPLSLLVTMVRPEQLPARVNAVQALYPQAHLGRLAAGRLGVVLPGVHLREAKERVKQVMGMSDVLSCTEQGALFGPGLTEAVLYSLEGPFGHAGIDMH